MENVPRHIGLILDGNRRFSKRLMMKPWKGHEWGAKKVEKLFEWVVDLGIKELTLYAFSIENFNRPKKEFDYLMKLFEKEFRKLIVEPKVMKNSMRINFIGRLWMFPESLQEAMTALMDKTKNNNKFIINIALAYGGRAEIIDATRRIAQQVKLGKLDVKDINEQVFQKELYIESEPDLIIRTSGEKRTSGFLLWQGSYAEFYFSDKLWPEFEKEDLVQAMKDYSNRERRFGK